jgi:outer membrane protein, heavy metal efflux system
MNLIRVIILPVIILGTCTARSQPSLDSLLSRVNQNNRTLEGARQFYENTRISAKTDLYPDNPEVEYAHLWGSPANLGNRTDFGVSQSFDFPGVYTKRSKLSKAGVEKASRIVENVRQTTLLEAKQLWVEKVYLNRKLRVQKKRVAEADQVSGFYRMQFENGEISRLKYNKALLLHASLRSELDMLEAESSVLDTEIARISGDPDITIVNQDYYLTDNAILDSVLQSSLSNPLYQAYKQEIEVLNLRKQLTRAAGMPKLKTGYYSEKVPGLHLQGFKLGITIPLWENANKVKAATGEVIFAELAAEKFRSDEVAAILQLHTRYRSFQKQIRELRLALENSNDPELLSLVVESGEISMVEYFYETDLYYRVLNDLLLAEKWLYLTESELTRYEL